MRIVLCLVDLVQLLWKDQTIEGGKAQRHHNQFTIDGCVRVADESHRRFFALDRD